jgi:hypothetical protein
MSVDTSQFDVMHEPIGIEGDCFLEAKSNMDILPLVRLRGSAFSTMITRPLGRKQDAPEDEDRDHQG